MHIPEDIKNLINQFNSLNESNTIKMRQNAENVKDIETPDTLTHCANFNHLYGILNDQQFGGKKVVSGNVFDVFDETNFSPVPIMLQGYYTGCMVVNAKNIEKKNSAKFHPTLYKTQEDCAYFGKNGWKKIKSKNTAADCDSDAHWKEGEWKIKNPAKFDIDDVDAVFFAKNEADSESVGKSIITALVMNGHSIAKINKSLKKFHLITVDRSKDGEKINYVRPFFNFDAPIKTVIACELGNNPMVDADAQIMEIVAKSNKKTRESIGMRGNCRIANENGNIELK